MPPKVVAKKDVLAPKEASLFKSILKFYEQKQYKKGLKAADAVLKKHPDHGETLSMKGLLLNSMDKKTEGYELVRLGLKNDLRSHVCWHVYGLMYRSDRDYSEAIKCYRNALRIEKDSAQILRDLSLLQVQTRDVKGFEETRQIMFDSNPKHKNNWLSLILACHLVGNLKKATMMTKELIATTKNVDHKTFDYELSETIMYYVMLLEEMEDYKEAVNVLEAEWSHITDKLEAREKKALFLVKLGRREEAEKVYRHLVLINPENHAYHRGLQYSLGFLDSPAEGTVIKVEHMEALLALYSELQTEYPKALACKRLPLGFTTGENFRKSADSYLRFMLRRGVPSLFADICPLYSEPAKITILEELVYGYLTSLRSSKKFPDSDKVEAPSVLLWTLFLVAQHHDQKRESSKAMEHIDAAIEHTPTLIELYQAKGKFFKHGGNLIQAHNWVDQARKMDLADRYLNTKCTAYALAADLVDAANDCISLFTKDSDNAATNLNDMQCMWFESACGNAHIRLGEKGKALKKFFATDKHFLDIIEDQFDFHSYCIRKNTLRSYVKLLRFEEKIYGHKYFLKAACGIIDCYLAIFDAPRAKDDSDENKYAGMTEQEKKKAISKARRDAARAARQAETDKEAAKVAEAASSKADGEKKKKKEPKAAVDEDPEGEKLLENDALTTACKFVKVLETHSAENYETHLRAFDVYLRKGKFLLCLRALKNACKVAPGHPEVHRRLVTFFDKVNKMDSLHPTVAQVIKVESAGKDMLGGKSVQDYNAAYLKENSDSFLSRNVAAELLVWLDESKKAEACKLLLNLAGSSKHLNECVRVCKVLEGLGDGAAAYRKECATLFPYSVFFNPEA